MRLAILEEEVQELYKAVEAMEVQLRSAVEAGDIVEVLDALCDIQYVLDGNFLEFGLHKLKHAAFSEVHASNMSKLSERPGTDDHYFG